jgi:hypothetical protein
MHPCGGMYATKWVGNYCEWIGILIQLLVDSSWRIRDLRDSSVTASWKIWFYGFAGHPVCACFTNIMGNVKYQQLECLYYNIVIFYKDSHIYKSEVTMGIRITSSLVCVHICESHCSTEREPFNERNTLPINKSNHHAIYVCICGNMRHLERSRHLLSFRRPDAHPLLVLRACTHCDEA